MSRTLASVGPNATLIASDIDEAIRGIRARREGEIDVCGTRMAQAVGELGLMDEYRLYLHPVVLGHGVPFFAGPRTGLRLAKTQPIGGEVIRLTYVPA